MQKEHLRSKEYNQVLMAEIEDLRKRVASTEALVMKQVTAINSVEVQLKRLLKNAEIMDEVPTIKNALEMLSFNVSRILSDTG